MVAGILGVLLALGKVVNVPIKKHVYHIDNGGSNKMLDTVMVRLNTFNIME